MGQAVETIGGYGSDAGVAATVAGLVYPPVAGGAAVFTELSGITEAGGQLVQDLTQGDVRAGLARVVYGIFGGKVASAVGRANAVTGTALLLWDAGNIGYCTYQKSGD